MHAARQYLFAAETSQAFQQWPTLLRLSRLRDQKEYK